MSLLFRIPKMYTKLYIYWIHFYICQTNFFLVTTKKFNFFFTNSRILTKKGTNHKKVNRFSSKILRNWMTCFDTNTISKKKKNLFIHYSPDYYSTQIWCFCKLRWGWKFYFDILIFDICNISMWTIVKSKIYLGTNNAKIFTFEMIDIKSIQFAQIGIINTFSLYLSRFFITNET